MNNYIATIALILGLLLVPITGDAKFVDIFDKELSAYEGIAEDEFNAKARLHKRHPFADDALAYEIKLPEVWLETKSFGYSLSKDIFTDTGRYIGPVKFNKARSHIVVKALDVGLQASAKTMASSYFMTSGYTVEGAKAYSRNHIETLHVQVEKGESYIVRSVFLMNGGKLIVMSYFLPSTSWKDERDLQYRVVKSFALTNKVKAKIEDLKSFDFWDLAKFSYPNNWQLERGVDQDFDHMDVMLLNYDGNLKKSGSLVVKGRITIDLFARHSYDDLTDVMAMKIDDMISQGLVIKQRQENVDPLIFPEVFENENLVVYNVLDSYTPNQKSEYWIVGAQAYGYYYVFSLIGPTKDENFMEWGANGEALQFIIEHMKPSEEW